MKAWEWQFDEILNPYFKELFGYHTLRIRVEPDDANEECQRVAETFKRLGERLLGVRDDPDADDGAGPKTLRL